MPSVLILPDEPAIGAPRGMELVGRMLLLPYILGAGEGVRRWMPTAGGKPNCDGGRLKLLGPELLGPLPPPLVPGPAWGARLRPCTPPRPLGPRILAGRLLVLGSPSLPANEWDFRCPPPAPSAAGGAV